MSRATRTLALLVSMGLMATPPALAQRDARVPDPDPEIERQSFEIAEGFEVNLFAADPVIAKPIQINFDAAGRLWIASSEVYPQIAPGQTANDKILILEDTDGDGKSDRTTIFADGLLIPTGVEPGDGGAYVANSTELLHVRDTNGDGKADAKRVVLSGFGTEDTHHILHTFRWGNDGQLYFNQSTYIHSHIETPWGVRRLGGGGIWQFRPETMQLEVFTRGLINPWGHEIDRWGQHFATDGAGGEGINYMIPGASYAWTPGASRIVAGLNPGSPKYCGLEILSGRHMPDDSQGLLVTNDFRANRVVRFQLSDDGSGFASRELPELIKTRFPAFRPIDVKMGPDGALYIADWYNPIIQHGEVDFRDPRRDHTHGRIWRVTAKGRPLVQRPKLVNATIPELLEQLKSAEGWTRHFAKRVLKERGAEQVVPALTDWVKGLDGNDEATEHHRLEALWTFQTLDVAEPNLLASLLHSADPRVRAAAVRVVPFWKDRVSSPLAMLAERVEDEHPRVRLEAVRALSQFAEPRAVEIAMRALDHPIDKFLDYGLWLTARELQPQWLPALQAGRLHFGGNARHLTFALQAAGSPKVVGPLLDAIQRKSLTDGRATEVFRLVGSLGNSEDLGRALKLALASQDPQERADRLASLVQGSSPRDVKPAGSLDELGALLDESDAALQAVAARAIGTWNVESLRPLLERRARSNASAEAIRLAAIDALAQLGGSSSVGVLDGLCKSDGSAAVRKEAVVALASLDPKAAAKRAVALLSNALPGDDSSDVFAAFVKRKDGPTALASALADRSLPRDVAKIGLRAAKGAGRPDPALIDAITRAGGLDAAPALPTPAEMEQLVADVARLGDPARGEAVFRRSDLQCLNCHAIAGAGGQVGPGLESIGASAPVDYLIDSLLQPNKAVKEGYHSVVVATDDGRILTGIVLRRTDSELILRDADGREITLATDAIEEEKPGNSLMPAGQTDVLTRAELIDLVRFLSELGKAGPYAVGQARLVRRWQVLPATVEVAVGLKRLGFDAAVRTRDDPRLTWMPVYSKVSGVLPLSDVPTVPERDGSPARKWVRFQLDVSTSGPLRLGLNAADGMMVWVDGDRQEARDEMNLDLSTGIHTVTFAIDPEHRRDDLTCELRDVPGSPARAQIVLGK